jgi:hypothetical protein
MDAKDILRIVLIFVIAIFALRQFHLFKSRNITKLNTAEENEETATQQFQQRFKSKSNIIIKEQLANENEIFAMKEVSM